MYNPIKELTKREWLIWLSSLAIVLVSNLLTADLDILTLAAALIGDIAYICGKGKCVGADIDGRIQHIIRYHILQVPLLGGDDNLPRDDDADGCVVSHNMV